MVTVPFLIFSDHSEIFILRHYKDSRKKVKEYNQWQLALKGLNMGMRSMTGFGRSSLQEQGVQISVEILSVNRKHLDINLILPKHLNRFDPEIRKKIGQNVSRGHLTARIFIVFLEEAPLAVKPNIAMAKQLQKGWNQIADALEIESGFSLSFLERESDLFIYEETEWMGKIGELLLKVVDQAIIPFMEMRSHEGSHLRTDILERISILKDHIAKIAAAAPQIAEIYREKLIKKVKEVLPLTEDTDERLLKEIILFAEKADITEEIVRFQSHILQFEALMSGDEEAIGKKLEFLVQEIGRETNTIGSKSSSEILITNSVMEIKTELERIREQIQNIE